MKRFALILLATAAMLAAWATDGTRLWLGGDISMLPSLQQRGAVYRDSTGRTVDPYDLFAQQGWNMMRVRLFVDPQHAPGRHRDEGVCQDLDYVVDLCRTIRDRGFEVMLDFHYSDTWADPAKQFTPQRWQGLDAATMADSLYRYTRHCLQALVEAGAEPAMIQVGNEITNGMTWPTGHVDPTGSDGWPALTTLLAAGCRACREVCPKAGIIIHTEKAGSWPVTKAYYSQLESAGIDYDIIGLSYYPMWHGTIEGLGTTLDSLAVHFASKPVMMVEAAYYYEHDGVNRGEEDFAQCPPGTIEGQRQFTADLVAELRRHANVTGLFWWFPEENRHGLKGHRGGGLNRGLFDSRTGCALPALYELRRFVAAPAPCPPLPTTEQLNWQRMERYAFVHFALNTFTDQEWGYGNESPSLFAPSALDCRQWARVCRQAGLQGIIVTAKHHGGFGLWPSAATSYTVAASPWRGGHGDVMRELADACRDEGLKLGIYLSPWDRHHPHYGSPAYIDYFRRQLRELLTNYGPIFEVWFDGANGGSGWYGGADTTRTIDRTTYYHWPATYELVHTLQPHCLVWNDGGDLAQLRWVGNEDGEAGVTNWSLMSRQGPASARELREGVPTGDVWVPAETNMSIRPGWFFHERENGQVKSVDRLMEAYCKSVGRNSTLLLNLPIAPDGRIHPADSARVVAFGQCLERAYGHDLARTATATASNTRGGDPLFAASCAIDGRPDTYWATDDGVTEASLLLDFGRPVAFNRFVAEEAIAMGQRVARFKLEALVGGRWQPLTDTLAGTGQQSLTTIGHRRIVCFDTVTATRLRFTIAESRACPLIASVGVYLDTQQ